MRFGEPLKAQVTFVTWQYERDLLDGYGSVELPILLARKFPNADKELGWQYFIRLIACPLLRAAGYSADTTQVPVDYTERIKRLHCWHR